MNKYGDYAIIEKVKARAEAEGTPLSNEIIQLLRVVIDIEAKAYMDGYNKGHADGWDEGYDEGYNYGKAARV